MKLGHLQKLKIILVLYLISHIYLQLFYSNLYQNIIHPIFWILILIDLVSYKKHHSIHLYKPIKKIIYVLYLTLIFILLYFCLGFFIGFSINPYQHTFLKIIQNFYIQVLPIIGLEVVRCFLLLRYKDKKSFPVLMTILFFFLEINYFILFQKIPSKEAFFKYLCSSIIPLLGAQFLFTYITLKSKYPIVLAFRIMDNLVILLAPILPSVDWFISGSLGLIKITIIYLLFKYQYTKDQHVKKIHKKNSFFMISYAFALVFATFLVSFMLGFFQYEPIVILSNSMYPIYERGDIVIFEKLSPKQRSHLSIGKIIIYELENQYIAHRIVSVMNHENNVSYVTKGDNNNVEDFYLVDSKNIQGIYKFSIPFIGFPSVWLNEYFHGEDTKVGIK